MTNPTFALTLEQLTRLMEDSPLGVYIMRPDDIEDDRSMRLLYGNKSSEAHTGVPPSQLMGRRSEECFPSLRERGFIDMFFRVLRTGEPENYEDMYYADNQLAAAFAGCFLALPGGLLATWFENVTKRKQVEAEAARAAVLADAARELEDRLAVIERQRNLIEELSTPILHVWDDVIAVPLVGALDPRRVAHVTDTVLTEIAARRVRFALLDVTGIHQIDVETARHLLQIAGAVRLLGARALVTGIQPAVAQAFVSHGLDLGAIEAYQTLRDALRECLSRRPTPALSGFRPR
jgi:anti-anti-sigma regulatory factor